MKNDYKRPNDTAISPLIEHILQVVKLNESEMATMERLWKTKLLEKGDYLLRNGDVCRYDSYVVSGTLKAYYINADNGQEEIIYFAVDDWWASDIYSFSKQQPSIYSIQALENSRLLQISFSSFQQLLEEVPRLEKYFRMMLESYVGKLQQRISYSHVHDAETRYYNFVQQYPLIARRVPQYLIASYLGVSPEFISRIRKKRKSA
ncbi:Crp/Fnr family transcriptional regulator [Sphingobacterium oryzagri]|uniref:Crp/Fnr family transcriptional regulator n=1 Tax=Sphingobacterium oryzagri TaxID=3025669 RepID=A0ABY7WEG5_9SPHI|nr:Crp/Fnr family transcriptional regulator [Sphingobacterium sp. KACC 22765]WDF67275.1 Crp/Fnr family transcriptional regulator [Sphingobacterium sp. KACC 22765]